MRKRLLSMVFMILLAFTVCGCGAFDLGSLGRDGKKEEQEGASDEKTAGDSGMDNSGADAKVFWIEIIGSDEVNLYLKDEAVNRLSGEIRTVALDDGSEATEAENDNGIQIYFFVQDEKVAQCAVNFTDRDINVYTNNYYDMTEAEGSYPENTVCWNVNMAGAAEFFQSCDMIYGNYTDYRDESENKQIFFYGTEKEVAEAFVTGGEIQEQDVLTSIFMDDRYGKIYIPHGKGGDKPEYLYLYATAEDYNSESEAFQLEFDIYEEWTNVYIWEMKRETEGEATYITPEQWIEPDNGEHPVVGEMVETDAGYVVRMQAEGLLNVFRDHLWYRMEGKSGQIIASGKAEAPYITEEDKTPFVCELLPDDVNTSYFTNRTDNYAVIVEEYPKTITFHYEWINVTGDGINQMWVYWPRGGSFVSAKVASVEFYDEFGLWSQYSAYVFNNHEEAVKALNNYSGNIADLSGKNEQDDSYFTEDAIIRRYMDTVNEEAAGSDRKENLLLGIEDNVLYFGRTIPYTKENYKTWDTSFFDYLGLNNQMFSGGTVSYPKRDIWERLVKDGELQESFSYEVTSIDPLWVYDYQEKCNDGKRTGKFYGMPPVYR